MNNSFWSRTSFALALLTFCAASAPSAILEYQAELGNPTYTFDSRSLSLTIFQLTGPAPTLTGTLNPGDQFRIIYSAPAGSLFSIFPRPGSSALFGFYADFWSTGSVNFPTTVTGAAISFVGASRPAPLPSSTDFTFGLPGQFFVSSVFDTDDFSFKSIIATFTVPAGYSDTFTNLSPALVRLSAYSRTITDTGAFASLIPDPNANVPEPASIFLVTTAMGCLAVVGRKRFRS